MLTPVLVAVMVVCFYVWPGPWYAQEPELQRTFAYSSDPALPWYNVFTPFACQADLMHLVNNVVMVLFAGVLLELTEGSLRLLCIAWGSQALAMGCHGAFDGRLVVGASGASYGFVWAQLALLLLNWREMSFRVMRLNSMILMMGMDLIYIFLVDGYRESIAVWAHAGGAIGGICVAIILGVNVRRLAHEVVLNVLGVLVYIALCMVLLAHDQHRAGFCAAALLVILVPWGFYDLRPVQDGRGSRDCPAPAAPEEPVDSEAHPPAPVVIGGSAV